MRRSFAGLALAFSWPLMLLAACGGATSTIAVHGNVVKTVGRTCDLLSAAFPGVSNRVVTFVDETGTEIGRATTGAERRQDDGRGGCNLSSSYRVELPFRPSYAANVSSDVEAVPTSPAILYDALAAAGWRFDIRIPATA